MNFSFLSLFTLTSKGYFHILTWEVQSLLISLNTTPTKTVLSKSNINNNVCFWSLDYIKISFYSWIGAWTLSATNSWVCLMNHKRGEFWTRVFLPSLYDIFIQKIVSWRIGISLWSQNPFSGSKWSDEAKKSFSWPAFDLRGNRWKERFPLNACWWALVSSGALAQRRMRESCRV